MTVAITIKLQIVVSLMIVIYDRNSFIIQATGGSRVPSYVLQLLFGEKSQNC
jgi:hypothetical protein